ncbi:MAG: hypothetical protein JJU20_03495 [Opitutales bacterium]|nr:hypothetical protein [Opitutales bacterium]
MIKPFKLSLFLCAIAVLPWMSHAQVTANDSDIVDEDDPRMQETVGTIRIPEMGTNDVLELLQEYTGKPILRQQNLPATRITFFSQGPLTRGEAILAIESLLALNGIAVTPLGERFIKAVPVSMITAQGAPIWEGTTQNAIPTQKIYEKVFRLDFLTPEEAVRYVDPLMSQGAPLAFDKSGFLLITDALINLQRIERILRIIDTPAALTSRMLFFQLENTEAQNVLRRLEQMKQGALRRQLENNTTFDADERTNQIIAFTHPSNEALITELVEKLDVNVAPLTSTRVFYIRYADATEVVNIMDQIVTGQTRARDQAGASRTGTRSASGDQQQRQRTTQQGSAASRDGTNLQFSDYLTIVPDERANTIVASGTQSDLTFLEQLIEEIDSLLAQVRIEVVITEVRLTDDDTRGIDSFGFRYNVVTPGSSSSAPVFGIDDGQTNVDQRVALPGNFYGATIPGVTWGPDGFGIEAILNAARTLSNVSVLSTPTIVTTHNKEAKVSVGELRPVLIGTTESGVSGTITNNIQFQDIKLELTVTPLIGVDGVIQMEVSQSIQSVIDNITIGNESRPVIGTRMAESYVSVGDGELVVLGGLQALDTSRQESRMALLGRLPVLGNLFTRTQDSRIRNELLIFIRPTIVRTTTQANRDAEQLVDVISSRDDIRRYLDTGTFRMETEDDYNEEDDEDSDSNIRDRRRPSSSPRR